MGKLVARVPYSLGALQQVRAVDYTPVATGLTEYVQFLAAISVCWQLD
jgi:hypothetical protein